LTTRDIRNKEEKELTKKKGNLNINPRYLMLYVGKNGLVKKHSGSARDRRVGSEGTLGEGEKYTGITQEKTRRLNSDGVNRSVIDAGR